MCEHRTTQCVAGYVSMLRRCGDATGPLGSSSHQTPSTGLVPKNVDHTRAVEEEERSKEARKQARKEGRKEERKKGRKEERKKGRKEE